MNHSTLAPRAILGDIARVGPRLHLHRPRGSLQAFRAWMNEPARHEPTPIAGHMSIPPLTAQIAPVMYED